MASYRPNPAFRLSHVVRAKHDRWVVMSVSRFVLALCWEGWSGCLPATDLAFNPADETWTGATFGDKDRYPILRTSHCFYVHDSMARRLRFDLVSSQEVVISQLRIELILSVYNYLEGPYFDIGWVRCAFSWQLALSLFLFWRVCRPTDCPGGKKAKRQAFVIQPYLHR